jgi:hypothetical protein
MISTKQYVAVLRGRASGKSETDAVDWICGLLDSGACQVSSVPMLFSAFSMQRKFHGSVLESAWKTLTRVPADDELITPSAPASASSSSASGSSAPVRRTRTTKQMQQLEQKMDRVTPADAVAALKARMSSKTSKSDDTRASVIRSYEVFCRKRNPPCAMFPLDSDRVVEYFAYTDDIYCSASVMWSALKKTHKDRLKSDPPPMPEVDEVVDFLDDEQKDDQEQAEPLTLKMADMFCKASRSDEEVRFALTMLGSRLTVARSECFSFLRAENIKFDGNDAVRIELTHLKGRSEKYNLKCRMEALPEDVVFTTKLGGVQMKICPVQVFQMIQAKLESRPNAPLYGSDTGTAATAAVNKRLDELCTNQGIANVEDGRRRKLYTSHSFRIGGVCSLLRAGLQIATISTLADWKSSMIMRYARKVMLDPTVAEPYKSYNPTSLALCYTGMDGTVDSEGPAPKRARK